VDVFTGGGVKVMVGVAVGGRGVSVGGGWAAPPQADAEKTKIIARPRHKSLWENCGFIFTPFFVDDPIFPGAAMLTQALINKLPKTANFSNSPLPPNEFKKAIAGKQKAPGIFSLGA
jgi:hypothetical protein